MAKAVGMGVKPIETAEEKKFSELEKENERLKKENEALKKAAEEQQGAQ